MVIIEFEWAQSTPATRDWICMIELSSRRLPSSSAPSTDTVESRISAGTLVGEHLERLFLLCDHQHPPAVGDVVTDQVGDRVGLARTRRTLDDHTRVAARQS